MLHVGIPTPTAFEALMRTRGTGVVSFDAAPSAANCGVVDEIAGRALLTGACVLAVRREDIPGGGSLAAITRYAM